MIWAFTEISNFYVGEFTKNQFNIEEGFPKKRGPWTVCKFRGGKAGGYWQERGGVGIFVEWGVNTPQCTLCIIWY